MLILFQSNKNWVSNNMAPICEVRDDSIFYHLQDQQRPGSACEKGLCADPESSVRGDQGFGEFQICPRMDFINILYVEYLRYNSYKNEIILFLEGC